MELLIDTNVILDLVLKRSNYPSAEETFRKIKSSKYFAYITASSVTDLFYIIRRETHDVEKTYEIMRNIFKLVSILPITSSDISDAFSKKWNDFEDCVLYTTALNNGIDCIITNNIKDFSEKKLPTITPQEFTKK